MDCKSWPSASSTSAPKRQNGHHTDPIIYPLEVNSLIWTRRGSKRSAEDSIERPTKRSRGSDSHSDTPPKASTPLNLQNNQQELMQPAQRSGRLNVGLFRRGPSGFSEWRKSGTKRSSDEPLPGPSKRSRRSDSPSNTSIKASTPLNPQKNQRRPITPPERTGRLNVGLFRRGPSGFSAWRKSGTKKSSDEPLSGPSKRSRRSDSPSRNEKTSLPSCSNTKIPHDEEEKIASPTAAENSHKKRSMKRCDLEKRLQRKSEEDFKEQLRQQKIQQEPEGKLWVQERQNIFDIEITLEPWRVEEKEKPKKKSEEKESPKKKSKETNRRCEDFKQGEKSGTSTSQAALYQKNKAAFEKKYVKSNILGTGGFGRVFLGHRKTDNKEVVIKCISKEYARFIETSISGKTEYLPTEVALLLKLRPQPGKTSAAVKLLEWFELSKDVILILEYKKSTMDLNAYLRLKRGILPENEARLIMKQVVDAFWEFHRKGVFHRDIKPENILIEPRDPVPRIWVIDFGCGEFLSTAYREEIGTEFYKTPEMIRGLFYKAEPTTVWQLGVLTYELLHKGIPFATERAILCDPPKIGATVSANAKDFIQTCLSKSEDKRPTLMILKNHPWLKGDAEARP